MAVKEDAADPKDGTADWEEPNAGEPKPEADVVAANVNGAAEGAGAGAGWGGGVCYMVTSMEYQQKETHLQRGEYRSK